MERKYIWIIIYICSLFIFLGYSFIYLGDYKHDRYYYSYNNIIRYLDDKVTTLPYGVDPKNAEEFAALKSGLDSLSSNIDQSLKYLKLAHKKNYYSYEEYITLKTDYEFSKRQLEKTIEIFDSKLK